MISHRGSSHVSFKIELCKKEIQFVFAISVTVCISGYWYLVVASVSIVGMYGQTFAQPNWEGPK